MPKNLRYTLRFPSELRTPWNPHPLFHNWRTNLMFPIFSVPGPRNRNSSDGGVPTGYAREGFLAVQHSLAQSVLRLQNESIELPDVEMRV